MKKRLIAGLILTVVLALLSYAVAEEETELMNITFDVEYDYRTVLELRLGAEI